MVEGSKFPPVKPSSSWLPDSREDIEVTAMRERLNRAYWHAYELMHETRRMIQTGGDNVELATVCRQADEAVAVLGRWRNDFNLSTTERVYPFASVFNRRRFLERALKREHEQREDPT